MLAEGISQYREARSEAGFDADAGIVTVMLHAFLGEDLGVVEETVREPMYGYLETFIGQGGHGVEEVGERERRRILEAAFERYFAHASLLGTIETASRTVERLADAGVDEVACLLDFGLDTEQVVAALPLLAELRRRFSGSEDDVRG